MSTEEDNQFNDPNNMNFALTNSRSLMPKIHAVIDYFDHLHLSFMMITETWLKNLSLLKLSSDLKLGHGLEIIAKNRPMKKGNIELNGGGAAIIFDPSKIHLKPLSLKKNNHEIVAATGKLPNLSLIHI